MSAAEKSVASRLPGLVFLTAELAPLASTGGLGDVAAALPRALAAKGHPVSVVLPLYKSVRERVGALERLGDVVVPGFSEAATLWRAPPRPEAPTLVLIGEDGRFDRPGLYGDSLGEYRDNLERFAFFSRAALEAILALDLPADVLHANDWHTGLVGAYRAAFHRETPRLGQAPLVFTIHNLAYQGRFPGSRYDVTGLPRRLFSIDGLEFHGDVSCMKAGIVYADAVTTVSPRYAAEILTPDNGEGLDGVLRHRREALHGILNGIDDERWDPRADPHLAARYGSEDLTGKRRCREALLAEVGLSLPPEVPVIGMVTRLAWQKGSDLVLTVGRELLRAGSPPGPGAALVLLGSGEATLERGFRELASRHPDRVAVRIGFDDALAHRIEAGADLFLMPSRYEPCGLNQMYSLRYGTVPVVRACGGLDDTVIDVGADPDHGNGFKFGPASPDAMLEAVARALAHFRHPGEWLVLQRRGMAEDFSWRHSAARYSELYVRLITPGG